MAAIKSDKTLAELAESFVVHPNQVSESKLLRQNSAAKIFEGLVIAKPMGQDIRAMARQDRATDTVE